MTLIVEKNGNSMLPKKLAEKLDVCWLVNKTKAPPHTPIPPAIVTGALLERTAINTQLEVMRKTVNHNVITS